MKIKYLILFICLFYACQKANKTPKAALAEVVSLPLETKRENGLLLNLEKSFIRWKGTKFMGAGSHEGIVKIAKGIVYFEDRAGRLNSQISGGEFLIDMQSIEVTDIPESDPIPRNNLRKHLLAEDFFFVEKYPSAKFEISKVEKKKEGIYQISGNLAMRGISRNISFEANFVGSNEKMIVAKAKFSLNRQHWGVAYRGSKLKNDLVDDEMLLDLYIETK